MANINNMLVNTFESSFRKAVGKTPSPFKLGDQDNIVICTILRYTTVSYFGSMPLHYILPCIHLVVAHTKRPFTVEYTTAIPALSRRSSLNSSGKRYHDS